MNHCIESSFSSDEGSQDGVIEEINTDDIGALTKYSNNNNNTSKSAGSSWSLMTQANKQTAFDKQVTGFVPYGIKPTKVNLFANAEWVEKVAYAHSCLDSIRFLRREPTVFVVQGMTDLCNTLIRNLLKQPETTEEAEILGIRERDLFHIDKWFIEKRGRGDLGFDPTDPELDPVILQREEQNAVDWVNILTFQEIQTPGFVRLFCNVLEAEDRVINQLEQRRARMFAFVGKNNTPLQLPVPHAN